MTEPGEFLRPIKPQLARVLAQAAGAAYAPAPTFYVVARYEPLTGSLTSMTTPPFNVQQPVPTYADAESQVLELARTDPGVEYGIFGPFENTEGGIRPLVDQATVGQLLVTPQGGATQEDPFTIQGTEFDALFYSLEAVEKFVLPYYTQEMSPEFASQVSLAFSSAPLALMGHLPWSEYIDVTDPNTAGAGSTGEASRKYIPVFFHRDETGKVQRHPMYPPRPAPAEA